MDARQVFRKHYRGVLRDEEAGKQMAQCRQAAETLIAQGRLMTAAVYRYGRQLFLYYEPIGEDLPPEAFMGALHPLLTPWPQKEALCDWALMYPVFWHCKPGTVDTWRRDPARARRRGRIALLRHDNMFEYVYHHFALTQEGLLRGDRYMTVALHEDVLFSYFEEPRSSDNARGEDAPSQAIRAWLDADPDSHFEPLPGSGGANFLLLDACFDVGM